MRLQPFKVGGFKSQGQHLVQSPAPHTPGPGIAWRWDEIVARSRARHVIQ